MINIKDILLIIQTPGRPGGNNYIFSKKNDIHFEFFIFYETLNFNLYRIKYVMNFHNT